MTHQTPKTITAEESAQLLAELLDASDAMNGYKKNVRNYCITLLMLDAGLRVGEAVRLKQTDLVLNAEPVKSLVLRASITKTHKERVVPLSERIQYCIEALRERVWFDMEDDNGFFAFYDDDPKHHVTERQVQRIIKAAAQTTIGRRVTPHTLRHTFGSKMMRVSSMRTTQELLGHARITSTQIYTHPNEDDKRKAIDSQG